MLDTIRRCLFRDARPIDTAMLIVEVLVLVLILAEFSWKIWDWYQEHFRIKRALLTRLGFLNLSEERALAGWVLRGQRPADDVCRSFTTDLPSLAERDSLEGWVIPKQYRGEITAWIKKRAKKLRD
jgi:hypothetical protein